MPSDRRHIERMELDLPALIKTKDEKGRAREHRITTRDVSSEGAYFVCHHQLPQDADVQVSMLLPRPKASESRGSRTLVNVSGIVVRADERGMAVRFSGKPRFSRIPCAS